MYIFILKKKKTYIIAKYYDDTVAILIYIYIHLDMCVSGEYIYDWIEKKWWNDLMVCGVRLMGKVASDKCHKWVFKEPSDCEPNISNYWQSSFDAVSIFYFLFIQLSTSLLFSLFLSSSLFILLVSLVSSPWFTISVGFYLNKLFFEV